MCEKNMVIFHPCHFWGFSITHKKMFCFAPVYPHCCIVVCPVTLPQAVQPVAGAGALNLTDDGRGNASTAVPPVR